MDVHIPVEYLAEVLAALASNVIAFLRYGVLFENMRMRLTGVTEMKPSAKSVLVALVEAWFLSWISGRKC